MQLPKSEGVINLHNLAPAVSPLRIFKPKHHLGSYPVKCIYRLLNYFSFIPFKTYLEKANGNPPMAIFGKVAKTAISEKFPKATMNKMVKNN